MKVMLFVAIGMFICGCSCSSTPKFVKLDLEEAMFEYHQKNGPLWEVQWKDIDQQGKIQLLKWLADSPMNGGICLTTYAPVVVVRAKRFNVNFTGDIAVCNYESLSGGWKQTSRTMSHADEKVCECIKRTAENLPKGIP